jgi:NAD(P)-dependent dehydrogenase (short-subunit alcohol dehydrogenase family)/acyl carrier protein
LTQIKSETRPAPAAVLTGAETPEGQSVALSLGRAGYRVCLLHLPSGEGSSSSAAFEPSAIPGHEKLRHEAVLADGLDGASLARAAQRAQELLGHVTALVFVALPSADTLDHETLDTAAFSSQVARQAGTFLALGLALLPGMFGTQTGTICLIGSAGGAGAPSPVGSTALLGALLGAVRELSERSAGTPVRSLALVVDGPRRALDPPALAVLNAQLGDAAAAGHNLGNGWFASLAAPGVRGPIDFLRPPPAEAAPPPVAAGPGPTAAPRGAPGKDRVAVQLAQTFRTAFGLAPNQDVSNLKVGDIKRWDSLGHLKLMMEVEQSLRVRLPADALSRIQSFKDLEQAVRANLPAR